MDGRRSVLQFPFRKFLLLLSMIGFVYQVVQVSRQYFAYKVSIRTEFSLQKKLTKHDIALCIRFNDILDIDRLQKETGIEIFRQTGNQSLALAIENEKFLTLKHIFDYTPNSSDLIQGCFFRPNNWDLRMGAAEECNKIYRVRRFVTQERMCYQVTDTTAFMPNRPSVSLSTYAPLMVYEVYFDERLSQADAVSVIAFTTHLPFVSRQFSSPAEYFFADKHVRVSNSISATPSDTRIISLESPYETGCANVSEESQYLCEFECLLDVMSPYNRLPSWHLILEGFDYGDRKLTSLGDSRNDTLRELLDNKTHACYKNCFARPPCDLSYTRTLASVSKMGDDALNLRSLSPPDPDVVSTEVATMSFIDFFTYICSCFGTWFGVCFLSLDRFCRHDDEKKVTAGNKEQREIVLESASFARAREVTINKDQSRSRSRPVFMTTVQPL